MYHFVYLYLVLHLYWSGFPRYLLFIRLCRTHPQELFGQFVTLTDEEYDRMMERHREACPDGDPETALMLQLMEAHTGSPRIIATHLTFDLINPNVLDTCKVNVTQSRIF